MSIVARLTNRSRDDRGAAALEAMLSIVLLFVAFYCMWGVALVIYNQSRLNTASQLSAQAALTVFDRSTYRGMDPDGRTYAAAVNRADHVAWSVFRENSCGMLPDQFDGKTPDTACDAPVGQQPPNFGMTITCASSLPPAGVAWSGNAAACQNGTISGANALRVEVSASIISPFDLLSPADSLNANHTDRAQMLHSTADAYSLAAIGKVR